MKTEIGHFTTQSSQSFPHDCELYDTIQRMSFLSHIIGNLAGDKAILYGCEKVGVRRTEGFVFVRTRRHPEGEVIWFAGGSESAGMYIKYETEQVSAMGIDFEEAYSRYWLEEGTGDEYFKWEDFTELSTLPDLKKEIEQNRVDIAALTPPPLGIVQIWTGKTVPTGYALCDGTPYRIDDYPELYKVVGDTFNSALSYTGLRYSTTAGFFRVPDLQSRFIVGKSSESDYSTMANAGGARTVTLSTANIPSHVHSVDDYYYIENFKSINTSKLFTSYERYSSATYCGSSGTDHDNDTLLYKTHNTKSTGSGTAHENRPPYYTLAYIIRMK